MKIRQLARRRLKIFNEQEDEIGLSKPKRKLKMLVAMKLKMLTWKQNLMSKSLPPRWKARSPLRTRKLKTLSILRTNLKDAVGGGEEAPEEEVGMEMDMEMGPEGEEMDMGAEEEELPMQEGLYEAALQRLGNIDLG